MRPSLSGSTEFGRPRLRSSVGRERVTSGARLLCASLAPYILLVGGIHCRWHVVLNVHNDLSDPMKEVSVMLTYRDIQRYIMKPVTAFRVYPAIRGPSQTITSSISFEMLIKIICSCLYLVSWHFVESVLN